MSRKLICAFLLTCLVAFSGAQASTDDVLLWSQLVDQTAQDYEDPFRALPADQLDDLVVIVRLQEHLQNGDPSDQIRPRIEARIDQKREALENAGVDVDRILAQRWAVAERRQQAALAPNPKINGDDVKIGGFLIPAPPTDDGRAAAYLVPQRGMCSHTPPPPPNQLLRLVLDQSADTLRLYEPVVVQGTLRMVESRREIMVVDGMAMMWSSWTLETSSLTSALDRPRNGEVNKETLPRRNR